MAFEHHSPTAFPLDAWLPHHVKVHSPGDLGGDRKGKTWPAGPEMRSCTCLLHRSAPAPGWRPHTVVCFRPSIYFPFRVWGDHKRVLQKLCGGSLAKLKPCARTCRLATGVELHFVRAPCRCGSFCPLVTFVIEKQGSVDLCLHCNGPATFTVDAPRTHREARAMRNVLPRKAAPLYRWARFGRAARKPAS